MGICKAYNMLLLIGAVYVYESCGLPSDRHVHDKVGATTTGACQNGLKEMVPERMYLVYKYCLKNARNDGSS
jgi:hypothetical protein